MTEDDTPETVAADPAAPINPTDPASDPATPPEFKPFLAPEPAAVVAVPVVAAPEVVGSVHPAPIDNPDAAMKVSSAPGMGFIPPVAPVAVAPDPVPVEVVHAAPVGEFGSDLETLSEDANSAGEKLGLDLMALERDLDNAGLSIIDVLKHTAKAAFGVDL